MVQARPAVVDVVVHHQQGDGLRGLLQDGDGLGLGDLAAAPVLFLARGIGLDLHQRAGFAVRRCQEMEEVGASGGIGGPRQHQQAAVIQGREVADAGVGAQRERQHLGLGRGRLVAGREEVRDRDAQDYRGVGGGGGAKAQIQAVADQGQALDPRPLVARPAEGTGQGAVADDFGEAPAPLHVLCFQGFCRG